MDFMNRNTNSHFSQNPVNLDIKRSMFDRSSGHKTTFNFGDLIPFYLDEVLPGDTFQIDTSIVCRMSTPLKPVMDSSNLDTYYFFVPSRLLWEHWEEFNGANKTDAWTQTTEYVIPQLNAPNDVGWQKGTIADYFGVPTNVDGFSLNALPFRAYALIYNDWFRDENLCTPAHLYLDDATRDGSNGNTYVSDIERGGKPAKVAKYFDYFTSALPEPQKGNDVLLPLGDTAPVSFTNSGITLAGNNSGAIGYLSAGTGSGSTHNLNVVATSGNFTNTEGLKVNTITGGIADLSEATAATINQLRQAFAIQRCLERDARGGSRYTELIRSHFGVTSPDSRLQRPEYLGGKRIPINMSQVLQTSASQTGETPQGNTAAFSLTADVSSNLTHSFTEHGYVIGLMCARTVHSYQQGLERLWSRKTRFDFYLPVFANLGETPVYNKEIYLTGNEEQDNGVFGYQEAWAEYRYKPNLVTGAFRSNYAQSLDFWHYADDYSQLPVLSADWIAETKSNVDRTLAVSSEVEDQLIADIYVKNICTRPMPMYSVPGLIDHN